MEEMVRGGITVFTTPYSHSLSSEARGVFLGVPVCKGFRFQLVPHGNRSGYIIHPRWLRLEITAHGCIPHFCIEHRH